MTFNEFATYLEHWNDWIITAMLMAGIVLHFRHRKTSTLLLSIGCASTLLGQLLAWFYTDTPSNPLFWAGLAIGTVGVILALVGFVWYLRKDYAAKSVNT